LIRESVADARGDCNAIECPFRISADIPAHGDACRTGPVGTRGGVTEHAAIRTPCSLDPLIGYTVCVRVCFE
jgi:hypothetical protein